MPLLTYWPHSMVIINHKLVALHVMKFAQSLSKLVALLSHPLWCVSVVLYVYRRPQIIRILTPVN